MRTPYAIILMLTIFLAGTYWYTQVGAVCQLPLSYRIGVLDDRFNFSFEEARAAVTDAESVWENATGRNLFVHDETADFSINFIFDDRQQSADSAENFRERLDAAENVSGAIGDTYAKLVAEHNKLNIQYEGLVVEYKANLNVYNAEVEHYNTSGGAPPEVYEELQQKKEALNVQMRSVNALGKELTKLSSEINAIGEKGNLLVQTYNKGVNTYNEKFGSSEEFTQGDYQGDRINIYTFSDIAELQRVLAHEFGHAMSLGHVEGEASLMYYLMGGQPDELQTSVEDVAEFQRVCGEIETFAQWQERLVIWLEKHGIAL